LVLKFLLIIIFQNIYTS